MTKKSYPTSLIKQQEARKNERREVIPGYPIKEPLKTQQEIDLYFSKNEVTCLLCGKSFKSLRPHLLGIHGCSTERYKKMYNIPTKYNLTGRGTNERLVAYAGPIKPRN